MSMTLQNLRDLVRNATDLDTTDLPDALLDPMVRDSYWKLANFSRVWSFYAKETTYSTVNATQTLALNNAVFGTAGLRDVTSITGPHWQLRPIPHEMARKRYPTTWLNNSEPTYYSVYANSIYFWPIPNGVYSMLIDGYRAPATIAAAGDTPDMPDEFHELLGWYAIGQAFAQQEDFEGAQYYTNLAESQLHVLADHYVDDGSNVPIVLNGGANWYYDATLPERLRYSWER